MSRLFLSLTAVVFAIFSQSAHASFEGTELMSPQVSVLAADPVCKPNDSVTVRASLEFQIGAFAWQHADAWDLCVNNGGESEIEVNFAHEPYKALFTVNGSRANSDGHTAWAFVVTRQDSVNAQNYGKTRKASFVLDPGASHRFQLNGYYKVQERNLRLTFSY